MAINEYVSQLKGITNLAELLDFCAENGKDNIAFSYKITRKEKMGKSFSQLHSDVFAISSALGHMGLSGERIAIIGENSIEWIEAFLAICVGGSVAVPLDKELSADELAKLLKRSNCKAVFYSESYKKKTDVLKENLAQVSFIGFSSLGELVVSGGNRLCDKVQINENDTAVIVSLQAQPATAKVLCSLRRICFQMHMQHSSVLSMHFKAATKSCCFYRCIILSDF